MCRWSIALFLLFLVCGASCSSGPVARVGAPDPLAVAFGAQPSLWGLRISPDGSKLSFLQMHETDLPIAAVFDTRTGKARLAVASVEGKFDVEWCGWANNERLLCGFSGIARDAHLLFPLTRLVAVDADGSNMKVLLQHQLRGQRTQFQDHIVDWLVDDPEHVLIAIPSSDGFGISRLDIYSGATRPETRPRAGIRGWLSDGRGTPRVRLYQSDRLNKWSYRLEGESDWRVLHESEVGQAESYRPIGFGQDPNKLFVLKPHEGRLALFAEHLSKNRESELVFAHPEVDVSEPLFLGKFRRLAAIGYSTDTPHLHFFDENVERVSNALSTTHPGQIVYVMDESWDGRYAVVLIGSDRNPGAFYRLDTKSGTLSRFSYRYPVLKGRRLAPMQAIHYAASDGTEVPAYLTIPPLPPGAREAARPAVLLPHGGPSARDDWGFDWIVQFLAAKGYAVLQSNYRGSSGYGDAWLGAGAFQSWRLAIDDIDDGARYLIESGIADPERLCVVGWSYGGYAALLSAIEKTDRYRCVVGIAPVTDPWMLIEDGQDFLHGRAVREFVGNDEEVLDAGSPLKRAGEIDVPVLLFHGDEDINVSVRHSRKMAKALKSATKPVEYVEYEEVEHQIARDGYRIDMLDRIGTFLSQHIGRPESVDPKERTAREPDRGSD
jgi:dipeptidyl aminopeptidase/acylaminoacyl peptidase